MNFLTDFVHFCSNHLMHSVDGMSYLRSRGSTKEQWSSYLVGFTPSFYEIDPSVDAKHDDTCETDPCDACRFIEWSGYHSNSPNISDCVLYPLTGYSGSIYGIQVRSIARKRYDTFVLKRRPESTFFGLGPSSFRIFSTKKVMLCEGPSDMLVLQRLVYPDVLALTTNTTNLSQQRFLDRFVDTIYLVLDLDKPGRDGCDVIIQRNQNKSVVNVRYPRDLGTVKDPGDLWKSLGDNKFSTIMRKAVSI